MRPKRNAFGQVGAVLYSSRLHRRVNSRVREDHVRARKARLAWRRCRSNVEFPGVGPHYAVRLVGVAGQGAVCLVADQEHLTQRGVSSQFHNGYRSAFAFELEPDETVVGVAQYYVRGWLRQRKKRVDREALDAWDGEEDARLPSGTAIDVIRLENTPTGEPAIKYHVTDEGEDGAYCVTVSAMEDTEREGWVAFLIEVGRDTGTTDEAIHDIHPPLIVENILGSRLAYDGNTRLRPQPRMIMRHDVDDLLQAIGDPSRGAPLLVASSTSPEADDQWRAMIKELTRGSIGTATVYTVSAQAVDELNARLPKTLQVESGRVRSIAPRVDLENPVGRRNRLWEPHQLTEFLDSAGNPTPEGVQALAYNPRRYVLELARPSNLRATAVLLDQAERRKRLNEVIDDRVADVTGSGGDDNAWPEDVADAIAGVLPGNIDVSKIGVSEDDFWEGFCALLARWLGKPASEVTKETFEDDLRALDRQIFRDQESVRVGRKFLSEVEEERDELRGRIAVLKEEMDSYAVQLEAERSRQKLREATQTAAGSQANNIIPAEVEVLQELEQRIRRMDHRVAEPRAEVASALQFMAEVLDPLIQAHLSEVLDGADWPAVLEQLDVARGREPGLCLRTDPAAQLRMLTEPLGGLGFPFEVGASHEVALIAEQLRELRLRWAYNEDLEAFDAASGYDSIYRLLTVLGAEEEAAVAEERRDAVIQTFGGPVAPPVDLTKEPLSPTAFDGGFSGGPAAGHSALERGWLGAGDGQATNAPSEKVMRRVDAKSTPLIGDYRVPFEPWEPTGLGCKQCLDDLIHPRNQKQVQMIIEEIVNFEGPISLVRLVDLTAKEFGLSRLHSGRRFDLENQVMRAQVVVDEDDFVWPKSINPNVWGEFRPNSPDVDRPFSDICFTELRNAARFILDQTPDLSYQELESEILSTFGKTRRTRQVRRELKRVYSAVNQ